MKFNKLLFITTLLTVLVSPANAQVSYWSPWSEILEIYPYNNGNILVMLNLPSAHNNEPNSCQLSNYFVLREDNAGFEEIYSSLLAAKFSGSVVKTFTHGCVTYRTGSNTYPEFKLLRVR